MKAAMLDTTKSFRYSYQLVTLSVLVAIFAVLQALNLRHTSPQHPERLLAAPLQWGRYSERPRG
jgi:NO-binding membrane sensor protein with MHYT domain